MENAPSAAVQSQWGMAPNLHWIWGDRDLTLVPNINVSAHPVCQRGARISAESSVLRCVERLYFDVMVGDSDAVPRPLGTLGKACDRRNGEIRLEILNGSTRFRPLGLRPTPRHIILATPVSAAAKKRLALRPRGDRPT